MSVGDMSTSILSVVRDLVCMMQPDHDKGVNG